ncbi:MAG TPA: hypothetical protein VKQ05_14085 [Gemmatimonadales bacterium]|nr:hypothetical protein [Gemmatimonadales bacterium]
MIERHRLRDGGGEHEQLARSDDDEEGESRAERQPASGSMLPWFRMFRHQRPASKDEKCYGAGEEDVMKEL